MTFEKMFYTELFSNVMTKAKVPIIKNVTLALREKIVYKGHVLISFINSYKIDQFYSFMVPSDISLLTLLPHTCAERQIGSTVATPYFFKTLSDISPNTVHMHADSWYGGCANSLTHYNLFSLLLQYIIEQALYNELHAMCLLTIIWSLLCSIKHSIMLHLTLSATCELPMEVCIYARYTCKKYSTKIKMLQFQV
jgi:hypothetical protein